jgi:flagellar motor switch protein FliM
VEMLETNPEFVQVVPSSETVVLISFELKSENMSGLINLCYPYISIEPIALRLGGQNLVSSSKEVPPEELLKNRKRIKLYNTVVHASLGSVNLTIRDLMDLKVGDVVTLNTRLKEDLEIYVDKELKFFGRPGLFGKYKAVEITARVFSEMEGDEQYG